ncbi:hypothetical protein HZA56_22555 [Candidatus Poribacteria bacterium]|nr:hypothetical protein [Candidatus Poribacteria bacterium]
MSKIIKPCDKELFHSAKRFEKRSLITASKPPRQRAKEEQVPTDDPPSMPRGNLKPELAIQQVNPQDLIAEARTKADKTLQEAECKAETMLADAERKAQQILREAENSAEKIREQARAEGRSEGAAQATDEARRRIDEQLRASSQAVDALVNQIKAQEADLMRRVTPMIANLAADLAQKIIHREVEKDSSMVMGQAEEAIGKILERDKLIIRVNPADEELMKRHKPSLMGMFDGIDKIEVIVDADIEGGGCIVETNLIRVDAQPRSQLEAARKTLLAEATK